MTRREPNRAYSLDRAAGRARKKWDSIQQQLETKLSVQLQTETKLPLLPGILHTRISLQRPIKRVSSEETMTNVKTAPDVKDSNFRWLQLAMGIVCMAMIANLQYGWTLFVDPIDAKYHWGRAAIQLAFTLFVVTETWLVPVEAWFVDKYGPSVVIAFGGVMISIAWVLTSDADSLTILYIAAIVAGIGAGSVYGTCVGNALK